MSDSCFERCSNCQKLPKRFTNMHAKSEISLSQHIYMRIHLFFCSK
jgi:hypothetical protein